MCDSVNKRAIAIFVDEVEPYLAVPGLASKAYSFRADVWESGKIRFLLKKTIKLSGVGYVEDPITLGSFLLKSFVYGDNADRYRKYLKRRIIDARKALAARASWISRFLEAVEKFGKGSEIEVCREAKEADPRLLRVLPDVLVHHTKYKSVVDGMWVSGVLSFGIRACTIFLSAFSRSFVSCQYDWVLCKIRENFVSSNVLSAYHLYQGDHVYPVVVRYSEVDPVQIARIVCYPEDPFVDLVCNGSKSVLNSIRHCKYVRFSDFGEYVERAAQVNATWRMKNISDVWS